MKKEGEKELLVSKLIFSEGQEEKRVNVMGRWEKRPGIKGPTLHGALPSLNAPTEIIAV